MMKFPPKRQMKMEDALNEYEVYMNDPTVKILRKAPMPTFSGWLFEQNVELTDFEKPI
jgi:hypothetical protein